MKLNGSSSLQSDFWVTSAETLSGSDLLDELCRRGQPNVHTHNKLGQFIRNKKIQGDGFGCT